MLSRISAMVGIQTVYRRGGAFELPTEKSRIQVTVDELLAEAMARIDPAPPSRSRLVRDLALRGAQALQQERAERARR